MAFIRIKPHHRKQYAYLVGSVWDSQRQVSLQRGIVYLGQVVQPRQQEVAFEEPYPKTYRAMIQKLVRHQCHCYGLATDAQERYLRSAPVQALLRFQPKRDEKRTEEDIERFATLYHQSGLPKTMHVVVALYQRLLGNKR